jgi:RhtB (resistance to homoserine/threonine) family protein
MVDTRDLKSLGSNSVWVRVPPRAPCTTLSLRSFGYMARHSLLTTHYQLLINMEYLPEFLTVATLHLLAVISPGPDFAMALKNSISYNRKIGIATAVGIGTAILIHVAYSIIGIGFIISQSVILYSIIKYLGAGYLIFIGYKALRSKKKTINVQYEKKEAPTLQKAFQIGFLTNALNPKATLFFFSLFTQVISPTTPLIIQSLYGIEMAFMTALWFTIVATIITHQKIQSKFSKVQHHTEKVFGALLILIGIKVATSE